MWHGWSHLAVALPRITVQPVRATVLGGCHKISHLLYPERGESMKAGDGARMRSGRTD